MNSDNHSDQVEQLLKSFRDVPTPDGPPVDVVNRTLGCLHEQLLHSSKSQISKRNLMYQASRHRAVIAACSLVVAFASWFGFINHSGSIAFADVKQELKKTRSVRYVETRLVQDVADDNPGTGTIRVASNAHQPRIIKILGRSLQRTEALNGLGGVDSIEISDLSKGKHVTLRPNEKKFVDLDTHVTIAPDSKSTLEEKVKPAPEADLFAQLSSVPADATTQLPVRTIAGKQVIGFFSAKTTPTKEGTVTWERTYWVDPATKLPVRVEISNYGTDKRLGRSDWVLSGFVFDEEIPAGQFSTEAPEGYARETEKVRGIKID